MKIPAIVGASTNKVIGVDNKIPWHMPADLQHFKKITSGHHIIMGRKNHESIGRALPNRTNVIITQNRQYFVSGTHIVHSLEDALELAYKNNEKEAFIIGGGMIYALAMALVDSIYYTEIHTQVEGDIFFPEISEELWECKKQEFHNDF